MRECPSLFITAAHNDRMFKLASWQVSLFHGASRLSRAWSVPAAVIYSSISTSMRSSA